MEGGEKGLLSHSLTAPGKKKPICVLLLTSVSQCEKPPGIPSALHPSILPPVHSSLHRRLPSSYAYLLIMLQDFSLSGMPYGLAG